MKPKMKTREICQSSCTPILRNNSAQIEYELEFNTKINHFKSHKRYQWLREYSDCALRFHTGFGYLAIKAIDFIDRINAMPLGYILDWLDGKNQLEWRGEQEGEEG